MCVTHIARFSGDGCLTIARNEGWPLHIVLVPGIDAARSQRGKKCTDRAPRRCACADRRVTNKGQEAVFRRQTSVMRRNCNRVAPNGARSNWAIFHRSLALGRLRAACSTRASAGSIALIVAAMAIALTASPVLAQQRTLCVHGLEAPQSLTVRNGPGTTSRVVGRFPAKACGVRLAGRCSGDWCQMALGSTSGWVDTRHIGVYEVPASDDAAADKRACVTNVDRDDTLRIRTGPGVDHDEIGDLPPRACGVAISETCRGNWCRISWRGRRGWVNTYYLD